MSVTVFVVAAGVVDDAAGGDLAAFAVEVVVTVAAALSVEGAASALAPSDASCTRTCGNRQHRQHAIHKACSGARGRQEEVLGHNTPRELKERVAR